MPRILWREGFIYGILNIYHLESNRLKKEYAMVPAERVEALRRKHDILSNEVERESKNAYVNERYLKMLKRQKLIIKEIIEGMQEETDLQKAS